MEARPTDQFLEIPHSCLRLNFWVLSKSFLKRQKIIHSLDDFLLQKILERVSLIFRGRCSVVGIAEETAMNSFMTWGPTLLDEAPVDRQVEFQIVGENWPTIENIGREVTLFIMHGGKERPVRISGIMPGGTSSSLRFRGCADFPVGVVPMINASFCRRVLVEICYEKKKPEGVIKILSVK